MSSKKRETCWTKSSGGKPYVVCKGSKGQQGVYKADNPRGPQNPERTAREQKEKEQAILERDRYREENTTKYGKYPDPVPAGAPSTDTMRNQLIKGGARESSVEGMGKRYIYKRWIEETKKGEGFAKKDRPPKERKKRPSRKGKGIRAKSFYEGGGSLAEQRHYVAGKIPTEITRGLTGEEIRAWAAVLHAEDRGASEDELRELREHRDSAELKERGDKVREKISETYEARFGERDRKIWERQQEWERGHSGRVVPGATIVPRGPVEESRAEILERRR